MEPIQVVADSNNRGVDVHSRNGILVFPYNVDHIVRIGDHVTCSCYGDWSCEFLRNTVQRLWDTNETFTQHSLMFTDRMPLVRCPICFEDYKFLDRGSDLSICDTCLRISCVNCIKKLPSSKCPICVTGQIEKFQCENDDEQASNTAKLGEQTMTNAKFDLIKNLVPVEPIICKSTSDCDLLLSRMLKAAEECRSRTKKYDYDKNKEMMEHNLHENIQNGLDPYYYFDFRSREAESNEIQLDESK